KGRDHGGRGRLPVSSPDRDRPFQPHQLPEHLRTPDYWEQPAACGVDFRIAASDGGRADDDLGFSQILSAVTDVDLDPQVTQPLDVGSVSHIAALHAITEIVHDL